MGAWHIQRQSLFKNNINNNNFQKRPGILLCNKHNYSYQRALNTCFFIVPWFHEKYFIRGQLYLRFTGEIVGDTHNEVFTMSQKVNRTVSQRRNFFLIRKVLATVYTKRSHQSRGPPSPFQFSKVIARSSAPRPNASLNAKTQFPLSTSHFIRKVHL